MAGWNLVMRVVMRVDRQIVLCLSSCATGIYRMRQHVAGHVRERPDRCSCVFTSRPASAVKQDS
jgi:hypothetical protein